MEYTELHRSNVLDWKQHPKNFELECSQRCNVHSQELLKTRQWRGPHSGCYKFTIRYACYSSENEQQKVVGASAVIGIGLH